MRKSHIVRLFISSTFSDFEEERNALKDQVFKKISERFPDKEIQFQAVDLRWGVSEADTISQRTMSICKEELKRCKELSPKPNFLFLLGDRYGWQPVPETIPVEEFLELSNQLNENALKKLEEWYRKDDNALEGVYVLRERELEEIEKDKESWEKIETQLRNILRQAINRLGWEENDPRKVKYFTSATEQEIISGLLESEEASEHVLCVMRTISNLPTYKENPNVKHFVDIDERTGEVDEYAQSRLSYLKKTVERVIPNNILRYKVEWTGIEPTKDHIENMCEGICTRLCDIISSRIKEDTPFISELEQEIEKHTQYVNSQLEYFTGRHKALSSIHAYTSKIFSNPLIVWGSSGSGKSALLAKATEEMRLNYPQAIVLRRFIGVTPTSFNINTLLESICQELENAYQVEPLDIVQEQPKGVKQWIERFRDLIAYASKDKPLLFVLDAINQLTNQEHALYLVQRLTSLSKYVHVILSSTEDFIRHLQKELLPTGIFYKMEDMLDEGEELLDKWLIQSKRTLQPSQRDYLLERYKECPLPLFLKLVFEQARYWRSWEEVDKDIEVGSTVYEAILGYLIWLEKRHGQVLTSRALSYLVMSRYGLSEHEWIGILSQVKNNDRAILQEVEERHPHSPKLDELPMHIYSSFLYDLRPYIKEVRQGDTYLFTFFHTKFKDVVEKEYLKKGLLQEDIYEKLIAYFEEQQIISRKVEELPWYLSQSKKWSDLLKILKDESLLVQVWERDKYEVLQYWSKIERNSSFNKQDAYREILRENIKYETDFLECCTDILYLTGCYEIALKFFSLLFDRLKDSAEDQKLVMYLINQAAIYLTRGEVDHALKMYEEAEQIARNIREQQGLAASLNNQGRVYKIRGELDRALNMYKECEQIARNIRDQEGIAASLNNQAGVYQDREELDRALNMYKESEQIARSIGNQAGVAISLNNQGRIFKIQGELDHALNMYKESEQIARSIGNQGSIATSLNNQAGVYEDQGELDHALNMYKESEQIARSIGNQEDIAISLNNQAGVYKNQGELDHALNMYKESEQISRNIGDQQGLAISLGNQVMVFSKKEAYNEGLIAIKEAIDIYFQLKDIKKLKITTEYCMNLFKELGEKNQSLAVLSQWQKNYKKLNYYKGVRWCLDERREILKTTTVPKKSTSSTIRNSTLSLVDWAKMKNFTWDITDKK
ncbi:tetratricopeptide repeat protein [Priestia aryabhattai]|uniref:tetratricopeptide repeat protein n=1 Tax=Priestia aryabhattai TaxID=412384 RepID=UPI00065359C4|nr:tetratricopeptide repeat protein [Priestia aryabhattai]KMN92416.1 hypothetical protein ABV89_27445 [Priestia aryabhattai]